MVAVINNSSSIRNVLHYNENKVKAEMAKLIHASGFAKDVDELNFNDKIRTFQKLTELNERTKVNSVHISLNFDPAESFKKERLGQIATAYMEKIGFSNQPFLVYQHHDAGHPHIHILTTNIKCDGTRIKLHNIGKIQSEKARKEIEKEFHLVEAESKKQKRAFELKPVNAQQVVYGRTGKSGTKRAITNVLDAILPSYKFTSLPELNAILEQYNIVADRGGKDSRIYKNNGLVYRVLNEKGEKVGVPIPASHIYNKPTLKFLLAKFALNEIARQSYKQRLRNTIDLVIAQKPGLSIENLISGLKKESIHVVLRQNDKGIIYGLTYIDHKTKCVFNGSDLGKPYSANQIQERCTSSNIYDKTNRQTVQPLPDSNKIRVSQPPMSDTREVRAKDLNDLFKLDSEGQLAAELKQDPKKKKRKRISH